MRFFTSQRAVNPVVATILLVGIVVVLSAAIGTFVLGLSTGLTNDTVAAVEVSNVITDSGNGTVVVTAISISRANHITVTATSDANLNKTGGTLQSAGESVRIQGSDVNSGKIEVNILAIAESGEQKTVILEKTVTI